MDYEYEDPEERDSFAYLNISYTFFPALAWCQVQSRWSINNFK